MPLSAEPPLSPEALAPVAAPFEAFGGAWVDPPMLQPLDLLLDLAGEAMRARLFVVQGAAGQEACLRPDFTIPLARAHIDSGAAAGRYLYRGKAFRVAPAGANRAAEFLQIGAELYGGDDRAGDDVEIAALAWRAALAGGRDDLSLTLGDVGLFAGFLQALDIPQAASTRLVAAFCRGRRVDPELRAAQADGAGSFSGAHLARVLAELPEAEAAGALEELWRLGGIQPVGGRRASEIVHRLALRAEAARGPRLSSAEAELVKGYLAVSAPPRQALDQVERLAYQAKVEFDVQLRPWIDRLKALSAAGVPEDSLTLTTGFARPFGYYDGMLFEVRSQTLGPDRPVAAGGRYDGLLSRLGAKGGPSAVGCMVRPARALARGPA